MKNNDEHDIEYVSKSRMKRDMHALQALGEKLVELSEEQIQQLNIPDQLRDAVVQAKAIKKHGAKRRQLQYIGRLMRNIDAGDIQQQYDNVTQHSAAAVAQLHQVEKWRERLLKDEDQALQAFLEQYPGTDRQQLRQLVRTARQEHLDNKPPKAYRKLFQFIKDLLAS